MMPNEAKVDRAIRVVLGLALLAMVFVGPQTWLGWLGVVPLVTGLVESYRRTPTSCTVAFGTAAGRWAKIATIPVKASSSGSYVGSRP
jgi:membrane protein implicated in regulation of membrane protease activity